MQCSFGHPTVEMIETSRSEIKTEHVDLLKIYYKCPTCSRELLYAYDKIRNQKRIEVITEGLFEKKQREEASRKRAEWDKAKQKEKEEENRKQYEYTGPSYKYNDTVIQCANNHPPINMIPINHQFYDDYGTVEGHWYQCPQCFENKLLCNQGILNEKNGREWEEKQKSINKIKRQKRAEENKKHAQDFARQEEERQQEQQKAAEEHRRAEAQELKRKKERLLYSLLFTAFGLLAYIPLSKLTGLGIYKFMSTFSVSGSGIGPSLGRLIYGPIVFFLIAGVIFLIVLAIERILDNFDLPAISLFVGLLIGILAQLAYSAIRFALVYLSFAEVESQRNAIFEIGNRISLFPVNAGIFGIFIFAALLISVAYWQIKESGLF